MKFRYIIYTVFLFIAVTGLLLFYDPPWSPLYCIKHSGTYSYAWSQPVTECEKRGCIVKKTEEFDIPNAVDASGYKYKCVKP